MPRAMPVSTSHDERIEIRAPSLEVAQWKRVAARDQKGLSAWLRDCAREASTKRSPAADLLLELRESVTRHRSNTPEGEWVLQLTYDDELALLQATARELGSELAARLLIEGPKGAFPRLFGLAVEWGQTNRGLRPAKPR